MDCRRKTMKKKLLLGIGLAALLTLTACGNTSKDTSEATTQTKEHYPLTVENFSKAEGGSTWEKERSSI